MKPGILAYHDKTHLSDKRYNSEIDIFVVMPLFNLDFCPNCLLSGVIRKISKVSTQDLSKLPI